MSGKIVSLSIDVVRRSLPADPVSGLPPFRDHIEQGVLRIITEDGIEGNCFIGEFWGRAEAEFGPILENIKPGLMGRHADHREWLWTRHKFLDSRYRVTTKSWAPVDIALWDIAGKAAGQPIFRLLGAQRTRAPAYASYPGARYETVEEFVGEAEDAMARGFPAYKIHPGLLPAGTVIPIVKAVRETVGDDVHLMLDPDCGYNFQKALKIGLALDDLDFHWFEDPVPYHDVDAITALSQRLNTPLSMCDQAPDQFFNSAQYIRRNIVRLPRGTALHLGITGLRKLCAMAEGFGLKCEIGTAGNPLLNAANLHVLLSVANSDYHEYYDAPEKDRFGLTAYVEPDDSGMVSVPDTPGLGFTLDEDWISAHRIETLE
ncbi:MAG: enolase C-terminal domain-like protein [Pseudomonadota bacterium]|nr:enolase C-terminal domain-like protein [Pseudomonadota bacterium]